MQLGTTISRDTAVEACPVEVSSKQVIVIKEDRELTNISWKLSKQQVLRIISGLRKTFIKRYIA